MMLRLKQTCSLLSVLTVSATLCMTTACKTSAPTPSSVKDEGTPVSDNDREIEIAWIDNTETYVAEMNAAVARIPRAAMGASGDSGRGLSSLLSPIVRRHDELADRLNAYSSRSISLSNQRTVVPFELIAPMATKASIAEVRETLKGLSRSLDELAQLRGMLVSQSLAVRREANAKVPRIVEALTLGSQRLEQQAKSWRDPPAPQTIPQSPEAPEVPVEADQG